MSGARRARAWLVLGLVVVVGAVGAFFALRDDVPDTEELMTASELSASKPTLLCVGGVTEDCRTAASIERVFRSSDLEIEAAARPPRGTQGTLVFAVETPDGEVLLAKWRTQEEHLINDPAKELAAYRVQQLLLDPPDYVVPPTTARCFERDDLVDATGLGDWETVAGSSCVLGYLSYWLSDVIDVDEARREGHHTGDPGDRDPELFDEQRFERDPAYRRNIANLNTLMFVIDNGDLHAAQFVLYPELDHWFVVDSSIAFESWHNPTILLLQDLSSLHVPSIPESLADRIRSIDREEVEPLAVLEEYEADDEGLLVPVEPGDVLGDADERARHRGGRLQIGMTPAEIDGVWTRIEEMRERLEDGSVGTF